MPAKKTSSKAKASPKKKAASRKATGKFTHIDRSNGELLRKSQLNKKKPWLSPISGQATVEKLTQEEDEKYN